MNAPRPRSPLSTLLLVLAAIIAILMGMWAAQQLLHRAQPQPALKVATLLPQPREVADFALTDHHERPFSLDNLRGQWTFLFFGYTHCPDICPTAMSVLGAVTKRIAQTPRRDDTRVVFISVDPERDTPQRLAEYTPYFNPDFTGVTGSDAQLESLTRQLGILYHRNEPKEPGGGYEVDHSASILLIDDKARLHAVFSAPHNPADIADDYLQLRNYDEDIR